MILHITNDYSGSTVYKNLVGELDKLGVSQIVYTPIKDNGRTGKNKIELSQEGAEIIYSHILNRSLDRVFYRWKLKKILSDIESKVDFSKVRLIHAHTWYSDGGVAYLLSKRYNIPYVITIRNSDLNVFYKYLPHERAFGRQIVMGAQKVILIGASYRGRLMQLSSLQKNTDDLLDKLVTIPNGVDPFWIEHAVIKKNRTDRKPFNILFVGKFGSGKNVVQLQLAVNEINRNSKIVHLDLVGGSGDHHQKVLNIVKSNSDTMSYHGKIHKFSELKKYLENADIFAMPSKYETFGLVYVEAMLQGLPILYTHNEGIDGFYEENIGEKVVLGRYSEIKTKLLKLIREYNSYNIPTDKLISNHDWRNIAGVYKKLYEQCQRVSNIDK